MGLRSNKAHESEKKLTFLNLMTATRAVGGVALGIGMTRYSLDPTMVAASAAALGATDLEGTALTLTERFPRFQKALRIIPSKIGRIADPVADKIWAISILVGGYFNGSIPVEHAGGVLATELATAVVSGIETKKGAELETSLPGTLGMVARIAMIGADLGAAATTGDMHNALATGGTVSGVVAVGLGAMSCYDLFQQGRNQAAL